MVAYTIKTVVFEGASAKAIEFTHEGKRYFKWVPEEKVMDGKFIEWLAEQLVNGEIDCD